MLTGSQKLKVIIADSSNFSRLVLTNMVQAQPDLEVLDTAANEMELVAAVRLQRPDVVLADLNLEYQRQLLCLQQVYQESGVPALVLLHQVNQSEGAAMKAAETGIYDYILKPAHQLQPRLRDMQGEILKKIRAVRQPEFVSTFSLPNDSVFALKTPAAKAPKGVIVIGASTGGTQAIEKIVARLDEKLDACVLIAVHLPAGFTGSFARRLQTLTSLKVVEGRPGLNLLKGKIIIAPGGKNMVVLPQLSRTGNYKIGFAPDSENVYDRPSVDKLMESVAAIGSKNVMGIVLTGMGSDGTKGLKAIRKKGGLTVAQDQASSVIFGMAKSAIEQGHVTHVRSLFRIPALINKFITDLPAAEAIQKPGF
ncbi:chemotaxis protein CheB [Adhaeribacter terreus]|uniref:protein-glutamate methylesterase n=1 Tax=Adhaeribacter terreus TaxID=529703 RepID=A0ABW0E8V4_9BACT